MTIRVAISGAAGRMGRQVLQALVGEEDMTPVAAFEAPGSPAVGRDAGEVAGVGNLGIPVSSSRELERVLREVSPDAFIDFTRPEASLEIAGACSRIGVPLIIGTTGFTPGEAAELEGTIRGGGACAVIAPNFSVGVHALLRLVEEAAGILGDSFDVEIVEIHHRRKKDAPSGTALRIAERLSRRTGRGLEEWGIFGRGRGIVGERRRGEIGIHAVRGGDVVGDHTVLFAGEGERLEITHRAHSRRAFVSGALRAVRFLHERGERGRVYTADEVLEPFL
jgi:4-hydroxy-tetrahydrodipicolinate reductase